MNLRKETKKNYGFANIFCGTKSNYNKITDRLHYFYCFNRASERARGRKKKWKICWNWCYRRSLTLRLKQYQFFFSFRSRSELFGREAEWFSWLSERTSIHPIKITFIDNLFSNGKQCLHIREFFFFLLFVLIAFCLNAQHCIQMILKFFEFTKSASDSHRFIYYLYLIRNICYSFFSTSSSSSFLW